MADPAGSWELLTTVKAWLSVISIANGYRTNLGQAVSLEPASSSSGGDRIVIAATDMPISERSAQGWNGSIDFTMELVLPAGRLDAQETAHKALADIVDALPLKQKGRGLPDQSSGVTLVSRRILQRPDGADIVIAQVTARAALIDRPTARS